MPINKKYLAKFLPNISYHVYNRTNGKENLFITDKDRIVFLSMMKNYLFPYFKIHCYCLLDNHFHILLTTKSFCNVLENLKRLSKQHLCITEEKYLNLPIERKLIDVHAIYKNQLTRLFLSYTRYFNQEHSRSGNLFNRRVKRTIVYSSLYFQKLVLYIHQNPVKHMLMIDFENYHWSSYHEYFGEMSFINSKSDVLEKFEGTYNLKVAHKKSNEYKLIANLLLE